MNITVSKKKFKTKIYEAFDYISCEKFEFGLYFDLSNSDIEITSKVQANGECIELTDVPSIQKFYSASIDADPLSKRQEIVDAIMKDFNGLIEEPKKYIDDGEQIDVYINWIDDDLTFENIITMSKKNPEKAVEFLKSNASRDYIFDEFEGEPGHEPNKGAGWLIDQTIGYFGAGGIPIPDIKQYSISNYDERRSMLLIIDDRSLIRTVTMKTGHDDVIFEMKMPKPNTKPE